MKRLVRALTQLPLATALGAGLGLLVALVAAVLSATPLRLTVHPLAPFALAPLPALLGAWIDWARLWRPSPRTRFWSFSFLLLSGIAAVEASVIASDQGTLGLLLAPAVPLTAAVLIGLGAGSLLWFGRRGVRLAGFELACGTIRKEDIERLVVHTGDGALEVDRSLSADLGPQREIDLRAGSTIALLARVRDAIPMSGPFRTERRAEVRTVLAVAASPRDLSRTVRRRARAWVGYLLVLALGAGAFAVTAAYQPSTSCETRALLIKRA